MCTCRIFYAYECFACIYVCTLHMCLVPAEARKGVLDSLELELQLVVTHQVDVGIQPGSSARITNVINY